MTRLLPPVTNLLHFHRNLYHALHAPLLAQSNQLAAMPRNVGKTQEERVYPSLANPTQEVVVHTTGWNATGFTLGHTSTVHYCE